MRRQRRPYLTTRVAVAIAVIVVASPSPAQDRPVVFQHGMRSNGETWAQAAQRLEGRLRIEATRPTLNEKVSYFTQSGEFADVTATINSPIVIGHSNGGQVARRANMNGVEMDGIVTVGSLHQGAELAQHMLDGSAYLALVALGTRVVEPIVVYGDYFTSNRVDIIFAIARQSGYRVHRALNTLPAQIAGTLGMNQERALPGGVLWDMVPGSAHYVGPLGVNSDANLARELLSGVQRIGVQVRVPSAYGLPWQAVVPDQAEEWTLAWWGFGAAYMLAYEYFSSYHSETDPYAYEKQSNALLWYMGAVAIGSLDANYCEFVGETEPTPGGVICEHSDALVTWDSQAYPNGFNIPIVNGPSHTRETVSPRVHDFLQTILENNFGVVRRPVGLRISPQLTQLYRTETVRLTVAGVDYEGNPTPVASGTWTSNNPAVASVNATTGNVTGVAVGDATISVSSEELVGSILISVLEPPPISAASISGPTSVTAGSSRTWTASATGGVAPLHYHWSVGGQSFGNNSPTFTYTNAGSTFTVYVVVTSGVGGSSKMASKRVSVSGSCGSFSC